MVRRQERCRVGNVPGDREWFRASVLQPERASELHRRRSRPRVLSLLRDVGGHRFLVNDISLTDVGVPPIVGHRQVTDAQLLALARRHGTRLVTFDAGIVALAEGRDVELLAA